MTPDRDVRRTVHVAPIEQHYIDLGVSEGCCESHGVFHTARASLVQGAALTCPWCREERRAVDRGRVAA